MASKERRRVSWECSPPVIMADMIHTRLKNSAYLLVVNYLFDLRQGPTSAKETVYVGRRLIPKAYSFDC